MSTTKVTKSYTETNGVGLNCKKNLLKKEEEIDLELVQDKKDSLLLEAHSISICIDSVDEVPLKENKMVQETLNESEDLSNSSLADDLNSLNISNNDKSELEMDCLDEPTSSSPTSNDHKFDSKDKKRSKQLVRCEALRESSLSPPPSTGIDSSQHSDSTTSKTNLNTNHLAVYNASSMSIKTSSKSNSSTNSCASSPSLSRDSSTDTNVLMSEAELKKFFIDTCKKAYKDRVFLLKIEKEFIQFINEPSKEATYTVPHSSSYNRMLVHKMADYFHLEHSPDHTHTSVILTRSLDSQIPEVKLKDLIKDLETLPIEPKKSILKRESTSQDDSSNGSFDKDKSPESSHLNGSLSDSSRSRSLEEREENYERVRARIFNENEDPEKTETVDDANQEQQQSSPPDESQNKDVCDNVVSTKNPQTDQVEEKKENNQKPQSITNQHSNSNDGSATNHKYSKQQAFKNHKTNNEISSRSFNYQHSNRFQNFRGSSNYRSVDNHSSNFNRIPSQNFACFRNSLPIDNLYPLRIQPNFNQGLRQVNPFVLESGYPSPSPMIHPEQVFPSVNLMNPPMISMLNHQGNSNNGGIVPNCNSNGAANSQSINLNPNNYFYSSLSNYPLIYGNAPPSTSMCGPSTGCSSGTLYHSNNALYPGTSSNFQMYAYPPSSNPMGIPIQNQQNLTLNMNKNNDMFQVVGEPNRNFSNLPKTSLNSAHVLNFPISSGPATGYPYMDIMEPNRNVAQLKSGGFQDSQDFKATSNSSYHVTNNSEHHHHPSFMNLKSNVTGVLGPRPFNAQTSASIYHANMNLNHHVKNNAINRSLHLQQQQHHHHQPQQQQLYKSNNKNLKNTNTANNRNSINNKRHDYQNQPHNQNHHHQQQQQQQQQKQSQYPPHRH